MRVLLTLAWRDLVLNRLQLICDVAMIAGVLVPLLVLLGAKTGVYQNLIDDLTLDPRLLQIDTRGNASMGVTQRETVEGWPETAFAVLKTRSFTDFVRVKGVEGRKIVNARLDPTRPGDPLLPEGVDLQPGEVAISQGLATTLDLEEGEMILIVSASEDRVQQLRAEKRVALIADPARVADNVILAPTALLQQLEAFYEGYALPDLGVPDGKPLATRSVDFEGMRIHARDLEALPALAARVEQYLEVRTRSNADRVRVTVQLGRNLDRAFNLLASVAVAGLVAALVSSFWAAVERKRQNLATLALLGLPHQRLALVPVLQALITVAMAMVASFVVLAAVRTIAQRIFSDRMDDGAQMIALQPSHFLWVTIGSFALVLLASIFSAARVLKIDPAIVLREVP